MQEAPTSSWTRRIGRELRGYLEALLIAFLITTFAVTAVGVAGPSMLPTLDGGTGGRLGGILHGDRLFIPKYETWLRRLGLLGGYERGEVVIVREPADSPLAGARRVLVVKRVIGVPGDTVAMVDGQVRINGHELEQDFITDGNVSLGRANFGPLRLGEGEYFILGDNRTNSADSRLYGPVEFGSITGRAAAVIWPPRRDGRWNVRALAVPEAFQAVPEPTAAE